jgi:DNA-directed RNA polymerase specialized sigma24 family protein
MDDFADFFATTRHRAFRAVLATTGNHARAEDAVAEAYARGYANWPSVREHPQPMAWILRTALNAHRSMWRRLRREVLAETPGPDRAGPPPDPVDLRVRAAVAGLPRRQREVVALRLLADLSPEETAAVLGLAVSTVGVHLHRALVTLRERLAPPGDNGGADGRPAPSPDRASDVDEVAFMMVVRHAF